ncbi:hypothetical protein LEP1GSC016_2236 [Leptospira borgpetersenii serovar Hardjo-bovis str. Sponselee]|uniref:Uncharacterized protein n=1 Tax=Leptospira borgpetersenii serovar Hardjo-bovis str. Sponselee TaxID=1303729 RepID=M6BII6_LEPBO|nr:hypothetical protein [Leptospira borgpetersenii]EMJ79502.1 hypothetical protein LEP1GSC016_2236 [Leptospira borgpetersenii serovar Hardjo-bovis str. Sponselee]MBE8377178.1 hypothetical protein [Leptospira borgpetersenii serovar Hardjo-bovis]MBF3319633.1 hypothetical protein [Leptospira borgpetersenii serovar Hardjo-bovis]UOZ23016.1 hypothetical protein K8O65_05330 [Leptospira borgpetersenii]UOZ28943.1 hypothetical protein K8O66_05325 [Leptospira borgpetersenii serovar Hardjo]
MLNSGWSSYTLRFWDKSFVEKDKFTNKNKFFGCSLIFTDFIPAHGTFEDEKKLSQKYLRMIGIGILLLDI